MSGFLLKRLREEAAAEEERRKRRENTMRVGIKRRWWWRRTTPISQNRRGGFFGFRTLGSIGPNSKRHVKELWIKREKEGVNKPSSSIIIIRLQLAKTFGATWFVCGYNCINFKVTIWLGWTQIHRSLITDVIYTSTVWIISIEWLKIIDWVIKFTSEKTPISLGSGQKGLSLFPSRIYYFYPCLFHI